MNMEKWKTEGPSRQILHIASELNRAGNLLDGGDRALFRSSLERAFELVDLTVECHPRMNRARELLRFREALGEFYVSPSRGVGDFRTLFGALLDLDPIAHTLKINGKEK